MMSDDQAELYRAYTSKLQETHVQRRSTWRPPVNVPYVVDNLWEWVRPEGYPSRRMAAFASPSIKEVKISQPADRPVFVYRVKLPAGSKVAQLRGHIDSKLHPEVDGLRRFIMVALGDKWSSLKSADKGSEALLFCPCLHANEVDSIVSKSKLLAVSGLREKIRYWSDIRLIVPEQDPMSPSGEIFFSVPEDGYDLVDQVEVD
jgi:hypothetical protein